MVSITLMKQKNKYIKHCIHCGVKLIVGTNWTTNKKEHYRYICSRCSTIGKEKWKTEHITEYRQKQKKWRNDNKKHIKKYMQRWKKKNKDKLQRIEKKRNIRRNGRRQKIMEELKINGCALCGYNKYYGALEFHHVNPDDKSFSIVASNIETHSDSKVVEEIEKCVLLCANCHKEVHKKIRDGRVVS